MSYASIGTKNEIGVRQDYSRRALAGVGVHRAPAETAPVSAYYPTRPLAGVRDFNTQSSTYALGVAMPVSPVAVRTNPFSTGPFLGPNSGLLPTRLSPVTARNFPASAAPPPASQSTPTPTTSPANPPPAGVAVSSGGPAAATAQSGTPVPVGTPTNQAFTDQNGNIWTFTRSAGWQVTGSAADQISASQAAPSPSGGSTGTTIPGTTVTVTNPDLWASLTSWLQSSSFSLGSFAVPNFFLVAGVSLVGLWLYGGGRRR